jgi:hypothetical protein
VNKPRATRKTNPAGKANWKLMEEIMAFITYNFSWLIILKDYTGMKPQKFKAFGKWLLL